MLRSHRSRTTPNVPKIGHIRRSAVPPAHRCAQLDAYDTRSLGATGLRPTQRARERPDGHRPHRHLAAWRQQERLGRSPLRLLLTADRAARQAQLLRVEEVFRAHLHLRRHAHQARVHGQQQQACRVCARCQLRTRKNAGAGQRGVSARTSKLSFARDLS